MKNLAPYIILQSNKDKTTDVYINDWELFDFVEDYLIEKCGIEFEYFSESKKDNKKNYIMHFSSKIKTQEIEQFLSRLNIKEIEKIYSLNNATSAG